MRTLGETLDRDAEAIEAAGICGEVVAVYDAAEGEFWFYDVDEDGEAWPVGHASSDAQGGYAGRLDTKGFSFESWRELQAESRRIMRRPVTVIYV